MDLGFIETAIRIVVGLVFLGATFGVATQAPTLTTTWHRINVGLATIFACLGFAAVFGIEASSFVWTLVAIICMAVYTIAMLGGSFAIYRRAMRRAEQAAQAQEEGAANEWPTPPPHLSQRPGDEDDDLEPWPSRDRYVRPVTGDESSDPDRWRREPLPRTWRTGTDAD